MGNHAAGPVGHCTARPGAPLFCRHSFHPVPLSRKSVFKDTLQQQARSESEDTERRGRKEAPVPVVRVTPPTADIQVAVVGATKACVCSLIIRPRLVSSPALSLLRLASVQRGGRRRGVVSMGRAPCCDRAAVKRGPWSPEEDDALRDYIQRHGTGGSWITFPKKAGLRRCGKSCRLRWLNYLRPDIRHGGFTDEEDALIFSLYSKLGSKWSLIASQLERRTDNDVKNHWNTKLKKRLAAFSSPPSSSSFLPAAAPVSAPAHPLALAVPTVKAETYAYDDFMALPPGALQFGGADQPGSTSASSASSASAAAADGFFADFCYPLNPTLSLV